MMDQSNRGFLLMSKIKKYGWMIRAIAKTKLKVKRAMVNGLRRKKNFYPRKATHADMGNLVKCSLCPNMCRFDCPAVQASKNETHSPAKKATIAYYLEMERLEKNDENIIPLFEGCVHCSACEIWCPFDFAVGDLLEGVAADLFKENALPQSINLFSQRISKNNGLYEQENYASSIKTLGSLDNGDVYYFPGCVTMGNNTKVVNSIQTIFEKSGSSIIATPKERWCCGAPSIYSGDLTTAKKLAKHNYEIIKSLKIKAIICECPECTYTLKKQYPKLGYDLKIPIYHIAEWIYVLLKKEKITLRSGEELEQYKNSLPISFHDPCVLARKLDVVRQPTELMKQMFPKSFIVNAYSMDQTHCCGFGGLVNVANPDLALKMTKNRLEEFARDKIKTIVTSCPTCWYSFMKANEDLDFEIQDLLELIAELIDKR